MDPHHFLARLHLTTRVMELKRTQLKIKIINHNHNHNHIHNHNYWDCVDQCTYYFIGNPNATRLHVIQCNSCISTRLIMTVIIYCNNKN